MDSRSMDVDCEETRTAVRVPAGLSAGVMGYEWERNNVGESGCAVYRLYGNLARLICS